MIVNRGKEKSGLLILFPWTEKKKELELDTL